MDKIIAEALNNLITILKQDNYLDAETRDKLHRLEQQLESDVVNYIGG